MNLKRGCRHKSNTSATATRARKPRALLSRHDLPHVLFDCRHAGASRHRGRREKLTLSATFVALARADARAVSARGEQTITSRAAARSTRLRSATHNMLTEQATTEKAANRQTEFTFAVDKRGNAVLPRCEMFASDDSPIARDLTASAANRRRTTAAARHTLISGSRFARCAAG
jgi:hypothetical protein